MSNNPEFNPEKPLGQFLPADVVGSIYEPAQIPEDAVIALDDIGLGLREDDVLDKPSQITPAELPKKNAVYDFSSTPSEVTIKGLIDILEEDAKAELSKQQCRALYGIDRPDDSDIDFSEHDSVLKRFTVLRACRSSFERADLAKALDLDEEQIALYQDEWLENQENIVYFRGDLDLWSVRSAKDLILPTCVSGSLDLRNLETSEGLELPKYIGEDLRLVKLKMLKDPLTIPSRIGGFIELDSLSNVKNMVFPKDYDVNTIALRSLTSTYGLSKILKSHKGKIFLPKKLKPPVDRMNKHPDLSISWERVA